MVTGKAQHRTSIAIWSVPVTVVAGERFTIRTGVRSSADCALAGCRIEALDESDSIVASGALGNARLPGTAALYWTELAVSAPEQLGMTLFSVHFDGSTLAPAHRDASAAFTVMVVPPPAHMVVVRVVAENAAPLADAEIRLGPHRATTTATGQAELCVAKGRYEFRLWKTGYEAPPRPITVEGDAFVQIDAAAVPEESSDRAWRG